MLDIDDALAAHIAGGATTLCTCWRVTRRDGSIFGFTDHDRALSFDGASFAPETGATGAARISSADLAVDNSEIEGILSASALSAGDLAAGRFDGALVEVFRVNWANAAMRALVKQGTLGAVTRQGAGFAAELRGLSQELEQTTGRVYQRNCDVNLGSAKCGIDLTSPQFSTSGSVVAATSSQEFLADGFDGFSENWFEHGALKWRSGENTGLEAHIKLQSVSGAITLWLPAGAPIAIGDAFDATAGCDKRIKTCRDKFSNVVNFRGFPFMPGEDFVITVPRREDVNDGGKRK